MNKIVANQRGEKVLQGLIMTGTLRLCVGEWRKACLPSGCWRDEHYSDEMRLRDTDENDGQSRKHKQAPSKGRGNKKAQSRGRGSDEGRAR